MDVSDGHAFEACHAVGDEAVGQREGQAVEGGGDVEQSVGTLRGVGSREGGHGQSGLHEGAADEVAAKGSDYGAILSDHDASLITMTDLFEALDAKAIIYQFE